ncbi:MAG: proton-conducting transporter membrane subunit [Eubacteriales bacterium]|nr:proton-conducting transporter membrane subunit [Eubacteriales bacterium]
MLYIVVILLPVLGAVLCKFIKKHHRQTMLAFLGLSLISVIALSLTNTPPLTLFAVGNLALSFAKDSISTLFALLFSGIFLLCGIYANGYFEKTKDIRNFCVFFLLSLSALLGLSLANSLATLFVLFVSAALLSSPLVSFDGTENAKKASKEYVKHSLTGAALALIGLFVIIPNLKSPYFVYGGALNEALNMPEFLFLLFSLIGIVGFASKAGLFPMHAWLPTAHPVAPTPASAVLSGLITKAGIISVIRLIFFSIGTSKLHGSFVQYTLMALSLFTVLMGSSLAYKQTMLKKRLAFSSVSQLSYILCALFLMNEFSLNAGLLHAVGHALVKSGLFLSFGLVIHKTHDTETSAFKGIEKYMPVTVLLTLLLSLSLVGIPPFMGFISKWEIAKAAQGGIFNLILPVVLIISAMLTASYLFPLSISAVFEKPHKEIKKHESDILMLLPIAILAVLALLGGFFMPLEVI